MDAGVHILLMQISEMQKGLHPEYLTPNGAVLPDGYRRVVSAEDVSSALADGLISLDRQGAAQVTERGREQLETVKAALRAFACAIRGS